MTVTRLDLEQADQVRDRPTWLELDRNALRHNLTQIIGLTLPGASILAVIKANAYGHGLLEVARSLNGLVAYFGVASIDEALALRRFEIDTPILLFGVPFRSATEAAIEAEVSIAVSSVEQAKEISEAAAKLRKPAVIHIKVDTGMGRLGISKASALSAIEQISKFPGLQLEGLFTHFPQGDEEDSFTKDQIRAFYRLIDQASEKGIHFAFRHAANSMGILNHREANFNLVRPGLTLYGIHPNAKLKRKLNLKPVLTWHTRIILIKKLAAGESTGYNRTFVAQKETTVGILPVGYSHGYPFALSNKGEVLFHGKRYPVVGRISMDYLAVDFGSGHSGAKTGETVTLLGRDGEDEISCEFLAERAGTIPYEIVTQINSAIPRVIL